jgi:hypothetical protein
MIDFDVVDNKMIVIFLAIITICLYYFANCDIKTNFLIGLIVGVYIVYYINSKQVADSNVRQVHNEIKTKTIRPNVEFLSDKQELLDFVFSIQDLYVYNPLAYEDMISNIQDFLILHDNALISEKNISFNFDLMVQRKRDALNNLASIIYKSPDDKRMTNKLAVAVSRLEDILIPYLDKIIFTYNDDIYKNGYDCTKSVIDLAPLPINTYDSIFDPSLKINYELF